MDESAASAANTWVIVVAAGAGTRFGGHKQYAELRGRRVLDWSLAAARSVVDARGGVVLVVPASGVAAVAQRGAGMAPSEPAVDVVVEGGRTRSASVRAGLAGVPEDADVVLVHDAARPVASPALFERVAAGVRDGADAVVPVVPVVDTIRHRDGRVVDRSTLLVVQTPQGFRAASLRSAHAEQPEATDDASLVEAAGGRLMVVDGERWNVKITERADLVVAAALLER